MVWTDNLNGFSEVVQETFHLTEVQKCIVHQVRNSLFSFCCKDLNSVMTEFKPIYKDPKEEFALETPSEFDGKWRGKYPIGIKRWMDNWPELATFFQVSCRVTSDYLHDECD